ncbi:hypothetical protein CNEO3_60014 [Clostridium neonatale]|nr:hypothetical protein CNEO3_130014 [Clostridium neonatale]CAI3608008.1 hypothetical protein CNEO3_180014 [Clostridium neonatale]CAI3733595.1 hypothetical protein CNEO3_60014 [Clostridium neonatale]
MINNILKILQKGNSKKGEYGYDIFRKEEGILMFSSFLIVRNY